MTAKEALHRLVEGLSEEDAASWLTRMSAVPGRNGPNRPIWEVFQCIMADVPTTDLEGLPSSDEIDRILYGAAASSPG